MSGHAQGPWHIRDEGHDVLNITNELRSDRMAPICTVGVGYDEPFESQQQANAHLIAAAPELVEALERFVKCRRSLDREAVS